MDRIPQADVKYLMRFYEGTPHVGVPLSSIEVLDYVDEVVYWEYLKNIFNNREYENHTYKEWIESECYNAGIEEENPSPPHERWMFWTPEAEQERRKCVLQWLVNRTIAYYREVGFDFRNRGSHQWQEWSHGNFRCNLREWKQVPEFVEGDGKD